MKLSIMLATAISLSVGTQAAIAGDAEAGAQAYLAKGCIGCHGPAGKSPNPAIYPSTAGKEAGYLVEQMKAFRDGKRVNPLMGPMSTSLTDEDIDNLAAYLSAQK